MNNTTASRIMEATIRARAFTGEKIREHRVMAGGNDGGILVWDDVAQHFTSCHILGHAAQTRAWESIMEARNA